MIDRIKGESQGFSVEGQIAVGCVGMCWVDGSTVLIQERQMDICGLDEGGVEVRSPEGSNKGLGSCYSFPVKP